MVPVTALGVGTANRTTTARLCTTLGVAALITAVVLALLPGAPAECGSLLAPMYPPDLGLACAAAQGIWLPGVVAAAVTGLLLLGAGASVVPSRRRRRR